VLTAADQTLPNAVEDPLDISIEVLSVCAATHILDLEPPYQVKIAFNSLADYLTKNRGEHYHVSWVRDRLQ
jgi:hypothetical protein